MKGTTLTIIALITVAMIYIVYGVYTNYEWETKYLSYWKLADKSSTIKAKSEYIDQFVKQIENNKQEFAPYNALIYKTPDKSLEKNLEALRTLQQRLKTIQNMNETEFAYQTAIQQITAQEQGEAQELIDTIRECWYLKKHPLYWGWGCILTMLLWFVLLGITIKMKTEETEYNYR